MRTTDRIPRLVRWGLPRPVRVLVRLVWVALFAVPVLVGWAVLQLTWDGSPEPDPGAAAGLGVLAFMVALPVAMAANFLLVAVFVAVHERSPWLGLKRGLDYSLGWVPDLLSS